ncbi:MAG: tRNA threonylcarbamoyladenosine dehydratase [Clostridiales bacterium]|nr:tRNA threonylcarbamoyladenosine dehydratase [Clostridiales bacterium]
MANGIAGREEFSRLRMLFGAAALERLAAARVAVFGIGGVGGYCVEALVRSGVGALELVDGDTVSPSNLNRQIIALRSTLGMNKTDAAAERAADINPDCRVGRHNVFWLPGTSPGFDLAGCDYIVDCVDTVSAKIGLVLAARDAGVPVISCMGMGNKTDPTMIRITDIYKTSVDPLAKVMRGRLKRLGVKKLKVAFSPEEPLVPLEAAADGGNKRAAPGSTAFVPSAAGLAIAGEVIKDIIGSDAKRGNEIQISDMEDEPE